MSPRQSRAAISIDLGWFGVVGGGLGVQSSPEQPRAAISMELGWYGVVWGALGCFGVERVIRGPGPSKTVVFWG